jgi:hypothetical protein
MWLGGYEQLRNQLTWQSTGATATYTNWSTNQPDNPRESCLQMWNNSGEWNDIDCAFISAPQTTMCEVLFRCSV